MKIRVEEYIRPDGSSPYAEWFDSLDAQAAAKVTTAKLRMELGNTSNVKWFAGIGDSNQISIGRKRCTLSTRREKCLRRSTAMPRSERGKDNGAYS
jgi:hypothetical protein